MENIVYKKADINDLDEIIKLGNLLAEFEITDKKNSFWDKQTLENCINNPNSGLIACSTCDGVLAGFMIIQYNKTFKNAFINHIFVLPKLRSLGIGKKLFQLVLNEIQKDDINTLSISIEFNNKSIIDFFENNNFDKTMNNVNLTLKLK